MCPQCSAPPLPHCQHSQPRLHARGMRALSYTPRGKPGEQKSVSAIKHKYIASGSER